MNPWIAGVAIGIIAGSIIPPHTQIDTPLVIGGAIALIVAYFLRSVKP